MEYLFDGTPENRLELDRMVKDGATILGAKCRTPLIIALDFEAAKDTTCLPDLLPQG